MSTGAPSPVTRAAGLDRHHQLHAVRAELLLRAARPAEATRAYGRALELTANARERAYLAARLAEAQSAAA
jgi:RNA polymerase sigma-70 factor (ECF subfamily)